MAKNSSSQNKFQGKSNESLEVVQMCHIGLIKFSRKIGRLAKFFLQKGKMSFKYTSLMVKQNVDISLCRYRLSHRLSSLLRTDDWASSKLGAGHITKMAVTAVITFSARLPNIKLVSLLDKENVTGTKERELIWFALTFPKLINYFASPLAALFKGVKKFYEKVILPVLISYPDYKD